MNPAAPPIRPMKLLANLLLVLFSLCAVIGCNRDVIRETGTHEDGSPAFEREYMLTEDARKIAHGSHATWNTSGTRRTLEFFDRGVREGFAFEWDESGVLVRLQACEAGLCRDRELPGRPIRSAEVLASTRFR
jgi:hypothetical protein